MRRPAPEAGFTLLEVVLAVAALAIVAMLLFATFKSTLRVVEAAEEASGHDYVARTSLSLLGADLSMSQTDRFYPWVGQDGFLGGGPADVLAFVSPSQAAPHPIRADIPLSRVVYAREGNSLVRYSTPHLYGFTVNPVQRDEVATGVTGFNVRYFDRQSQQWAAQWDVRSNSGLPAAVMIELTLEHPGRAHRTFTEWVIIPAGNL